jgi:hypothetical protein
MTAAKKVLPKGFKLPKALGACADLYNKYRAERLAYAKGVEPLANAESALREHLINTLPKSDASGVAGKEVRVAVYTSEIFQLDDWDTFLAYVIKHKAWHMLQRGFSTEAVDELLAAGKVKKLSVLGLKKVNIVKLSCNKL